MDPIKQEEISAKLDIAFETVLYALLAFMPFAFGVVHAWSRLIVLLAAASLLALQAARFLIDKSARPVFSWALLPLALFILVPVLQWIPLPAGVVRFLSPNTYQTKTELLSRLPVPPISSRIEVYKAKGVDSIETESQSNSSFHKSQFSILNSGKMSLSFYPYATSNGFRLVLAVATVFLVTLQYFTTPHRIKRLLAWITAVGGAAALLAILQDITRTDKIFWIVPAGHRVAEAGPFVNHNNYGQFINLSMGAALALIFIKFHELLKGRTRPRHAVPDKDKSNGLIDAHDPVMLLSDIAGYLTGPRSRWFWCTLAMIILSAASVFLSLTRGGMLTLLIAAAFTTLLLTTRGSIRGRGWIMALMALGAFICVLWIGFDAVYDRLATLSDLERAQGGRWQIVQDIATAWTKFPAFGTGLDTHLYVYPVFDRSTIPSLAAHAENEYAQLAEEMGLAGLLPMILFGVLVGFAYVRCIRRSQTPICSAAYGLGFGLLAILLHSLSDFGQHLPANASLTAVFCALLLVLSKTTVQKGIGNQQLAVSLNREMIISGMSGHAGQQELAPMTGRDDQAAVCSAKTDLNSLHDLRGEKTIRGNPSQSVVEYSKTIQNSKLKTQNYTAMAASFLLSAVLFWLILSPQGALSACSAEKDFTAARKSAAFLEELSWQGSSAQYVDLLRVAQRASDTQPGNLEYRHWLNVWRWRSMGRFTDAAGNLILPPQALGHVARLVDEFCDGIRGCPVHGQSWTVAGQLLYFILERETAVMSNQLLVVSRENSEAGKKEDSLELKSYRFELRADNEMNPVNPVKNNPSQPVLRSFSEEGSVVKIDNNFLHDLRVENKTGNSPGAAMIRTGYQLAPCDATVCFVTGLLEVEEYKKAISDKPLAMSSNDSAGADPRVAPSNDRLVGGSDSTKANSQQPTANSQQPTANSSRPVANDINQSEGSNTVNSVDADIAETREQKQVLKSASAMDASAVSQTAGLNRPVNPVKNKGSVGGFHAFRGENKIENWKLEIGNPSAPGFFYFSRCLQLDGRFFIDIAQVYLGIDRPDLVVDLASDDISRLNQAARLLSDYDSQLAQAARQKVFDILSIKSESPDVSAGTLASLAAIYAKDGKTAEAIDLYKRALTMDYGNIGLRYQLAVLLGKDGDIESAIKECRIILRLRPDFASAIRLIEQLSTK
jgi:hypothetical protein